VRQGAAEQGVAMNMVIEFFRIREADDAHTIIGQEIADATDLDDAIEIARHLWQNLDMPQQPDAITISDSEGNKLYSGRFDPDENSR
jgi:hypothetical protein